MAKYGNFYRLNNGGGQTPAVAKLQIASGEIWGKTPKNGGMEPTVQAYAGQLPRPDGIEFTTDIEPHPNGTPIEVRWYLTKTPGVQLRYDALGEEHACITADIHGCLP